MICPIESLYTDAHETTLGTRYVTSSLQYATKIKSLPKHPTHHTVFDINIGCCFMRRRMPSVHLAFVYNRFYTFTLTSPAFWKGLHILFHHLVFDIVHLSKMV